MEGGLGKSREASQSELCIWPYFLSFFLHLYWSIIWPYFHHYLKETEECRKGHGQLRKVLLEKETERVKTLWYRGTERNMSLLFFIKYRKLPYCIYYLLFKSCTCGDSLSVPWLGLCVVTAEGPGSIPGWGPKIPQALQPIKKERKEKILFNCTS